MQLGRIIRRLRVFDIAVAEIRFLQPDGDPEYARKAGNRILPAVNHREV
jgi:hypothetical protein